MNNQNVTRSVDASQPQQTPAGRLLGKMYYSGFLEAALKREEYAGYPHNGGSHTLRLFLNGMDLNAFLSMVKEAFSTDMDGVNEFIHNVLKKVTTGDVQTVRR